MAITMTTIELKQMFDRINVDCAKSGESVVDYDDTEFYTDQICNIFEVDKDTASKTAHQLLALSALSALTF
jgi:hypothetical protein